VGLIHSSVNITEKFARLSIAEGTGVPGVGRGKSSPVTGADVAMGYVTPQERRSFSVPAGPVVKDGGDELLSPSVPVTPTSPEAAALPRPERAASPSLESSKPSAHNTRAPGPMVPCGGWIREVCAHNNVRWIPLACHKWGCEYCAPGKLMELLERLQGAHTASMEKGWTLKFVTLTWAEDVTKKQVRLHLAHLVQAIRRKYGYCEYAKVPEWTKNHRIHLHLAMIMPYIRQKELSDMWRRTSGAPSVWITAVQDVNRLRNELGKYLAKGPAGKVTYSRQFPDAEPVVVKSGPCDACGGREHTFMFISVIEAETNFRLEVLGRDDPGLAVRPTGGVAGDCGCWPGRDDDWIPPPEGEKHI